VLQSLAEKGISCGIHYPIPVHLQEALPVPGPGAGSYPVAERCAGEFLSLPMFPELTHEQIHAVAEELLLCLSAAKPQAVCDEVICNVEREAMPIPAHDGWRSCPVNPLEQPGWDGLLAAHPDAWFFHGTAWAWVLRETYGHCAGLCCAL